MNLKNNAKEFNKNMIITKKDFMIRIHSINIIKEWGKLIKTIFKPSKTLLIFKTFTLINKINEKTLS